MTDCLLVFDLPLLMCKTVDTHVFKYDRLEMYVIKRVVGSIISCNRSKPHEMAVTILICGHYFFLEKKTFYIITKENCEYVYTHLVDIIFSYLVPNRFFFSFWCWLNCVPQKGKLKF